ncbi:MAG: D-serine ammonia-lyase [Halanaerobiales bacterium]|nr:D-serine ammonia-lyase [Halanaerobiales bacterium]
MFSKNKIEKWKRKYSLLEDIINTKEVIWLNPKYQTTESHSDIELSKENIIEAEKRLNRFKPYIKEVFPETKKNNGLIESVLESINDFKGDLEDIFNTSIDGSLYIKRDDSLPIAGSIKARGGIYEVLKYAETLALKNNLITKDENYEKFVNKEFKTFFNEYSLAVGSTGNLGLSIGIMGATLGFKTTVHMSNDAKEWKKRLLREKGVHVKEYESDYSKAVEEGRKLSENDPRSYFIDDEKSKDLFLGYAVAALRLKKQFESRNITVNKNNPLFVYLPCGVGGGPGGICFGLKKVFGEGVYCFFAEPTHSPAMLIGMMTEEHNNISVQDLGIDNKTAADGLAVGTPSKFVGKIMENYLAGIYTIQDEILFQLLKKLYNKKRIKLEPSAVAGFPGPAKIRQNHIYKKFDIEKKNINHLIWATGGIMVPEYIFQEYLLN